MEPGSNLWISHLSAAFISHPIPVLYVMVLYLEKLVPVCLCYVAYISKKDLQLAIAYVLEENP